MCLMRQSECNCLQVVLDSYVLSVRLFAKLLGTTMFHRRDCLVTELYGMDVEHLLADSRFIPLPDEQVRSMGSQLLKAVVCE